MKKLALIFLAIVCLGLAAFAQVPDAFKYQAVLRNSDGEIISGQNITLKISIINESSTGDVVYSEEHSANTNDLGMVSLNIGDGTVVSGNFQSILWGESEKFLKIELDESGGSTFSELGTFQLLSVPYALFANSASKLGNNVLYSTSPDTLFVVKDQEGNPVFVVYPDGAEVITNGETKGKIGGFAVSGRTSSKAGGEDIFRVTPDSTRIYINEPVIKGSIGGFAVSGRTASKGLVNDYLYVTEDSTRIYVNGTTASKGKIGGFAVSGRSSTKGSNQPMFFTTVDSTRIFTKDANKGFGVSDNSTGISLSYLNLSPQNYFIGHRSGDNNSGGSYNLFLGYESGRWNNSGGSNVFIGPNAGHQNSTGFGNIFIGNRAGYSNANIDSSAMIGTEGSYNVYIGYNSAEDVTRGRYNTYIGYATCASGITGEFNTYIGNQAGNQSKGNNNVFLGVKAGELAREGNANVFLGNFAGHRCYNGSGNVFVGYYAGYGADVDNTLIIGNNSSSKLITGDFTDNQVGINGDPSVTAGNILRVNSGTTNGYYSSSGWTHSSDRRLKTNIETVEGALDKVLKMNGVFFNWIDNTDKRQVGFIAQDMQDVLPEVVHKGEEDYLTITYDNVVPVLVNAIKEQQDLIKDMQMENEELKQKLNEIIKLLKK